MKNNSMVNNGVFSTLFRRFPVTGGMLLKQALFGGAGLVFFLLFLPSLEAAGPPPLHPEEVIDIQEAVKGQLVNLKRRLEDIAGRLEKVSKQDAEKVETLNKEFRVRNIDKQLQQIVLKLKDDNYTSAAEMQQRLIRHLEAMIRQLEGRRWGAQQWEEKLAGVKDARKRLSSLLRSQRQLRKASEESVSDQEEMNRLSGFSQKIDSVLSEQRTLSSRLPEGPLADEKSAMELLKELDGIRSRQGELMEKVKNSPGGQALQGIRNQAEGLKKALESGTLGTSGKQRLSTLEKQVRTTLSDPALADAIHKNRDLAGRKEKAVMRGLLDRVASKSKKGGLLPSHVPEQAALEYRVREFQKKLEKNLRGSADASEDDYKNTGSALEASAGAMKRAVRSLSSGQRRQAVQVQKEALKSLQDAQNALSGMNRALRSRDRMARAAAAQRRLAEKTGALKEGADRLQRKLRRKERKEAAAETGGLLKEALKSMQQATDAFSNGRLAGRSSARKAAEQLEQAKKKLQEGAVKRLRRQEALRKIAEKQDDLRKKTDDTAEKLQAGEEGVLRRAGPKLRRAGAEMGKASSSFRGNKASQGAAAQKRAEEELAEAEQSLRKEERELERLRQEEQLTDMVELLVSMRDKQKEIYSGIVEAEQSRTQTGRLSRRKLVELRNLGRKQEEVIGDGEKVRDLLQKEKAQVFAFVVEDILGDMEQIHESVGGRRPETGRFVQVLANDVIDKLEKLLLAMKRELTQRRKPKPKQKGGRQGRVALVPPVAEALMLKRMQLDLNEKVEDLQRSRMAAGGELNNAMERFLKRLALKQGSLASLTKKVAKDFFGREPGEITTKEEGNNGKQK